MLGGKMILREDLKRKVTESGRVYRRNPVKSYITKKNDPVQIPIMTVKAAPG